MAFASRYFAGSVWAMRFSSGSRAHNGITAIASNSSFMRDLHSFPGPHRRGSGNDDIRKKNLPLLTRTRYAKTVRPRGPSETISTSGCSSPQAHTMRTGDRHLRCRPHGGDGWAYVYVTVLISERPSGVEIGAGG